TTISEGMAPDALVNLLNRYLSKMTNVIVRNHLGTLDKYIGDAIMAFWGAPLPHKEHALLACSAAVEMMNELNIFNKETRLKKPLNIGIGINTAGMLVGNMGSEVRMDYTLIGDGVNLGSRLESINKYYKTNIIISEATYEQVKSNVIVRELDLVRVKGKNKPVQIFELIDLK
ncbi:MAG: adenylate/guanylate cyclase domain-containing protein, partial [Spirochaetes bacterium]|nr:adenylate/guanylate cyclase domain-containing protein [Spirochaetota bacterium]